MTYREFRKTAQINPEPTTVMTLDQWIESGNNWREYLDYISAESKPPKDYHLAWNDLTGSGIGRPCPACNHRNETDNCAPVEDGHYIICENCGAHFGDYWGHKSTEKIVKREWDDTECPIEKTTYFDFTVFAMVGGEVEIMGRRHGWYNTENKKIVQIG
jgi:hypothetical protein